LYFLAIMESAQAEAIPSGSGEPRIATKTFFPENFLNTLESPCSLFFPVILRIYLD